MKKIVINNKNSGIRLDKFLVREFFSLGLTRGEIIRRIKNGKVLVLVNGKKVKSSYILHQNDTISYKLLTTNYRLIPNSNLKIKIIYQDENIIAVDKPAGLSVHPSKLEEKDTLVNFLTYKFPEIENIHDNLGDSWMRPGVVHRLDKDTSGVMVIARNIKVFEELKKLFKEHKVEKKYLAIVYGKPKEKEGVIEKPIARAATYKKQVIAGRKTKTKIREAVTHYKVLKEFTNHSLLEVIPKTGRMHQIRIHLFSISHPVVGDKLYKLKKVKKIKAPRQLLHAENLKLKLFGKNYSFHSALPDDFKKSVKIID